MNYNKIINKAHTVYSTSVKEYPVNMVKLAKQMGFVVVKSEYDKLIVCVDRHSSNIENVFDKFKSYKVISIPDTFSYIESRYAIAYLLAEYIINNERDILKEYAYINQYAVDDIKLELADKLIIPMKSFRSLYRKHYKKSNLNITINELSELYEAPKECIIRQLW